MAEQNKKVAKSDDKNYQPKGVTQNLPNPLPFPWSALTQAYHNFGATLTSSIYPSASHFYSPWFGSQMWNTPIQYGSVCHPRRYSNFYPLVAGASACSLLASAHIQSPFAGKNMDLLNKFNKSIQPESKVTEQSREKGKRPSIPDTNGEGRMASESKETTVVGHDVKNAAGSTKFSFKLQDIPSIKQEQSSTKTGNGRGAQDMASNENTNITSDHFKANPTELNQKLSTEPNTSCNNLQLVKEESDETEEKRKRQTKKTAKRSKRKFLKLQDIPLTDQEQSNTVPGTGGASKNASGIENCNVVHKKTKIALRSGQIARNVTNPTKLNEKLSADPNTSVATTPQLENKKIEAKELRREQAKKNANKRARMKITMECKRIVDSMDSLDVENAALKQELDDLSHECEKLTKENNSLMEELFDKFGKEVIMNLMNEQPTDLVAAGGGGQSLIAIKDLNYD